MAEISAIIVTVVVPFSRCSSGAIERREAQFDRRDERLNRRDQQFEHEIGGRCPDPLGYVPGSAGRIAGVGASDLERRVVPDRNPW